MGRINLLDPLLSSRIAAGEVIERPQSVLREFLDNSLDAEADDITVIIEGGGIDRLEVQDNGKGIGPEIQDRIFQPYFTTKINHDGLGLSVAERTVFLHYGNIRFLAPQGGGATFYVDLPAVN